MSTSSKLQQSIQESPAGLILAELLARHPQIARRTAQRLISQMISTRQITAHGEGRARRYYPINAESAVAQTDQFPEFIPLSADSRDILAYINQPPEVRKPVGYQRDFLESYQPNKTWYLSEPLRRQLHKTGRTPQAEAPAGTYSRAILNRLLIDLGVKSSGREYLFPARYP